MPATHESIAMAATQSVHWTEMVRALWPILMVVGSSILAAIILALTTKFATVVALKGLDKRVTDLETYRATQEATLLVLPTRQQLGERIQELSETVAGMEAKLEGVGIQLGTTNTYLHSLIDQNARASRR